MSPAERAEGAGHPACCEIHSRGVGRAWGTLLGKPGARLSCTSVR